MIWNNMLFYFAYVVWYCIQEVKKKHGTHSDKVGKMSMIEEADPKCVNMAHLAIFCCHTINGVAAIHSDLIKRDM